MDRCYFWFGRYPELFDMYSLYNYRTLMESPRYTYTTIPFYRQDGPQCGLVALAMIMKQATKETVDELFETAKQANFTYHGEMYSVRDMCQLARMKLKDYRVELYEGDLNCSFIEQFLFDGGHMLVPHDSSADFTPGLYKGHKAHWAAVSGCLESKGIIYVLARQGKSKKMGLWTLESLAASNGQLEDMGPISEDFTGMEFKLPEGGIDGPNGLKSKSVLLYPKTD